MLVFVRMAVMGMGFTYTALDQHKVGLYEQQRKHDVADTAGQPNRQKQKDEDKGQQGNPLGGSKSREVK